MASALASPGRFVERVDGCVSTGHGGADPDVATPCSARMLCSRTGLSADPACLPGGHEKAASRAHKNHAAAGDACSGVPNGRAVSRIGVRWRVRAHTAGQPGSCVLAVPTTSVVPAPHAGHAHDSGTGDCVLAHVGTVRTHAAAWSGPQMPKFRRRGHSVRAACARRAPYGENAYVRHDHMPCTRQRGGRNRWSGSRA